MTEKKSLLVLRLEGVLQSWGESAKWDFRDSSTMPTKSGIVGLLGCALGAERGSAVLEELAGSITIAVRADRSGVKFVDFQTVQGNPLMAATGKPKSTGNTILSLHAYLQDACFTVFIETSDVWRERLAAALKNPKWCMYLGRKNCVPGRPVLECENAVFPGLEEALRDYPAAERAECPMIYEMECPGEAAAGLFRPDALVGVERQFEMRRVWRGVIGEVQHVSDKS